MGIFLVSDPDKKITLLELCRRSFLILIPAYVMVILVLTVAIVLWQWKGIPLGNLTRDPSNILGTPFYLGAISSFGIILWAATATVCFFTAIVGRQAASNTNTSRFLLCSGLFTVFLMFDDLFLFHEVVFPHYLHIPEYVVYVTYMLICLFFLFYFRRVIITTYFPIFIAAGGFLGLSMISDLLTNSAPDVSIKFLIEDGLKLFGIMSWFIYYTHLCIKEMKPH